MTETATKALWSKISDNSIFTPVTFLVEGDAKEGYNISYIDKNECGFSLLPSYSRIRSFYAVKRLIDDINTNGYPKDWNKVLDMRSFAWHNIPMPENICPVS
jgi:hypothetical protein